MQKSISTYHENHFNDELKKALDDEISKRFPEETEEQKEIKRVGQEMRQLKQELKEKDQMIKKGQIQESLYEKLIEKGYENSKLKPFLLKLIVDDEE